MQNSYIATWEIPEHIESPIGSGSIDVSANTASKAKEKAVKFIAKSLRIHTTDVIITSVTAIYGK